MKKILKLSAPLLLVLATIGCKKDYLDTNPSNQVVPDVIFKDVNGAKVALNGAYRLYYTSYTNHGNFGPKSYDIVADLMGNDMVVHSQGYGWFNTDYRYTAQLSAVNASRSDVMWAFYYRIINNANGIINNIDNVAGSQEEKDNIKGQALAMRAHCYYYLVNFFQQTYKGNETKPGVPIYTASTTQGAPRGTVQDVYDLIVDDLTTAEDLLEGKPREHISNIDVQTVQGIRARVALTMEDWANAATYANKARQGHSPMSTTQFRQGFSKVTDGNPEWIWGFEVITDQATIYASFYSHMDVTMGGYAALGGQKKITKALYDQIPATDVRKQVWTAPGAGAGANVEYNQTKFHAPVAGNWAADYVIMRAGEMYLIEAEALARQGQNGPAVTVLESLITARDPNYTAAGLTGTDLINEILLQRRIELWGEGFALFDIKRLKTGLNRPTGAGNHGLPNYDPVLYTLPDGDPKFLMRIPQRELDASEVLGPADQNPS